MRKRFTSWTSIATTAALRPIREPGTFIGCSYSRLELVLDVPLQSLNSQGLEVKQQKLYRIIVLQSLWLRVQSLTKLQRSPMSEQVARPLWKVRQTSVALP